MSEDVIKGDKILEEMAATYRERNAAYKNNYAKVGQILAILYPAGIQLKTADDFTRWHLVDWMVGKLTRFSCGNHMDSIHDLAVYAAMVEGWLKHENRKAGDAEWKPEGASIFEGQAIPGVFTGMPDEFSEEDKKRARTIIGLPI